MSVIFDENVILLASQMTDEFGNTDTTCTHILVNIIHKCDTIICVTPELYLKYMKKLGTLKKRYELIIMKLLNHAWVQGKIKSYTFTPKLKCEKDLPTDDRYLIRLAALTRSILVSTDIRLKDKVELFCGEYNIKIIHPKAFPNVQ